MQQLPRCDGHKSRYRGRVPHGRAQDSGLGHRGSNQPAQQGGHPAGEAKGPGHPGL